MKGGDEYITRIKLIDFDDLGVSFLVIIVNYIPSYFTVTNCFYFLYDIFGVFFLGHERPSSNLAIQFGILNVERGVFFFNLHIS